jgi:hypothetical protein
MVERILRGSRLGGASYEADRDTDLAPRQAVTYTCPRSHKFSVPLAAEAEAPPTWECKLCGAVALRLDGPELSPKKGKPARTHWDMLLERRSTEDLEEVLAERLAVLRDTPRKTA